MVERRDKTDTDGRGLGHSFAADNVDRGDPDVDFIKRRPTYPIGDDPRGREIDFEDDTLDGSQAIGHRPVYRAYRGNAPLEGQEFGMPERVGSLDSITDLRPELPDKSVDFAALEAAKEIERERLAETKFQALFPSVSIKSPAPGQSFSVGSQIQIVTGVTVLQGLQSVLLFVGGRSVERRVLDRRDQDAFRHGDFTFYYTIPSNQVLGPLDITIRAYNVSNALQGFVADDATNTPPNADGIDKAVGTLDGRIGQLYGSERTAPLLEASSFLRTPDSVISISINVI